MYHDYITWGPFSQHEDARLMATVRLLLNSSDLVPQASIFLFEDHLMASAKTEDDIYGAPVVITRELPSGHATWTVGAAYVSLAVAQACISAYDNNSDLSLVDELGATTTVVISDYPVIERHKSMTDVLYTVKLNLIAKSTNFVTPPVLSTTGPRLFGR